MEEDHETRRMFRHTFREPVSVSRPPFAAVAVLNRMLGEAAAHPLFSSLLLSSPLFSSLLLSSLARFGVRSPRRMNK